MQIDTSLFQKKIELTSTLIKELENKHFTQEELEHDLDTYSTIYYLYQNIIERCLGLAVLTLQMEDKTLPDSAKETFSQLATKGIIQRDTSNKMGAAYGFRNLLIHEYDQIDPKKLYNDHPHNIQNLKQFLKEITQYFEKHQ